MARMTLNIEADAVGEMMRRIEANGRLPAANRLVLDHFRTLPVTRLWGGGIQASADMMSLDATRRLWTARHDPRRRTPAVGTYTHVLDQWVILHDQAVVLNRRQAGAAIEGALRHEAVDLHRVAVDTHGHTHFGMALANLVGFDLAPRLAGMNKRKLYLPRGLDVPASLRPIVSETVSTSAITRGWDPLLRIAASTKSGWCSATYVLDRFGSAARGDEAFQAGDAFGRLLLTRFLGAYLGDPAFRGMNDALLSQGELVHTLQRAIYSGADRRTAWPHARTNGRDIIRPDTAYQRYHDVERDPDRLGSSANAGHLSGSSHHAHRPQCARAYQHQRRHHH